jgi:hypothetical protein
VIDRLHFPKTEPDGRGLCFGHRIAYAYGNARKWLHGRTITRTVSASLVARVLGARAGR